MSELDEILHDLDHQKYEAIGVEALANDTKTLMSGILILIQAAGTSNAQDLAILLTLIEILQEKSCARCLELSHRIKRQIIGDFNEFHARKEQERNRNR